MGFLFGGDKGGGGDGGAAAAAAAAEAAEKARQEKEMAEKRERKAAYGQQTLAGGQTGPIAGAQDSGLGVVAQKGLLNTKLG